MKKLRVQAIAWSWNGVKSTRITNTEKNLITIKPKQFKEQSLGISRNVWKTCVISFIHISAIFPLFLVDNKSICNWRCFYNTRRKWKSPFNNEFPKMTEKRFSKTLRKIVFRRFPVTLETFTEKCWESVLKKITVFISKEFSQFLFINFRKFLHYILHNERCRGTCHYSKVH